MKYLDAYEDAGNDYRTATRDAQNNPSQEWVLTSTHAECPASSDYVRVEGKTGNCESHGYYTIPNHGVCVQAFDVCKYNDKQSTAYETVEDVSYSFYWTGCQSMCYNEHAGHFCRQYNNAVCESGDCSGATNYQEGAFMLCQKTKPPTPSPTPNPTDHPAAYKPT